MLAIEVHEQADEELKAAAIFYETREAGLGDSFLRRITEAFESIKLNHRQAHLSPVKFDGDSFANFPTQLFIVSRQRESSSSL